MSLDDSCSSMVPCRVGGLASGLIMGTTGLCSEGL